MVIFLAICLIGYIFGQNMVIFFGGYIFGRYNFGGYIIRVIFFPPIDQYARKPNQHQMQD